MNRISDWEAINRATYNNIANEYHNKTKDLDMKWQIAMFTEQLPKSGTILDFMSGGSRDVKKFHELGFKVSATDYEQGFLDIIARDVPAAKTYQGDARTVNTGEQYDGVWCSTGIFMFPRQEAFQVIENIAKHVKPDGSLYINFKVQNMLDPVEERVYEDKKYDGAKRYESFFSLFEMNGLLSPFFDIRREMVAYNQNPAYRTHPIMDLFCVKK